MSLDNPLVSILMTSFNSSLYIQQAISSVLAQTYTNWELLIADDCSTDNTRELINKFDDPRIRKFHNDFNLHYLRSRNKLVGHVKGDFITLLDADDLAEVNRLELQLHAFEKDDQLGMCGTQVRFIDRLGSHLDIEDSKPLSFEEIKDKIRNENVFTGSTIMVKTSIWNEIGGYRDYFNSLGYEDYDLTSRIVEKYKCVNLPNKLYLYRQYPESTSKKDLIYNPFKLHGHSLVKKCIEDRAATGEDLVSKGDFPSIINFIIEQHKPFIDDSSLIYRNMMWSYLNKGLNSMATRFILKAIYIKPFNWTNWRTFIIYVLLRLRIIKE
ncbi:MAG: glycosyltransferase [Bacteroidota bacterium]